MSVQSRFTTQMRRALRHMTPAHIVRTRITRKTITNFADKVGLVYFGYVDQRDDEHRLVRGHTVSDTHQDNHYCVGSVKGYDVMMVLRNDVLAGPREHDEEQRCHWLIATVDLHSKYEFPHLYIGHHNRDHAFQASFEALHPLMLGSLHEYPYTFLSDYTVYAKATHAVEVERMITPAIAQVVAEHFAGASIEIDGNTIFLYIESPRPTEATLEKMLANALWLAESLDIREEASA